MADDEIVFEADSPLQRLQPLSFAGIQWPWARIVITGGIRHHVHEFPHRPGGETEKMGRSLYKLQIQSDFHDLPDSVMARQYPDLYPQQLAKLIRLWEKQTTDDLVVPGKGKIRAFCTNWVETLDARIDSGEALSLDFAEDDERSVVTNTPSYSSGALAQRSDSMLVLADENGFRYSLFQQINDVITDILAIQGTADMYSRVAQAKLLSVIELCSIACDTLDVMQDPLNFKMLDAVKDVWLAAQNMNEDLTNRRSPILKFVLPSQMNTSQISRAIFGDGEHVQDIVNLNVIEDSFAVPAGTVIQYYRAT